MPGLHKHPSEILGHLPSICWSYVVAQGGLEDHVLTIAEPLAVVSLNTHTEFQPSL